MAEHSIAWFKSDILFNITDDHKNYSLASVSADTHQPGCRHGEPDQRSRGDESYRKIPDHSNSIIDRAVRATGRIISYGLDTATRDSAPSFLENHDFNRCLFCQGNQACPYTTS
jgi:hypothetical protein